MRSHDFSGIPKHPPVSSYPSTHFHTQSSIHSPASSFPTPSHPHTQPSIYLPIHKRSSLPYTHGYTHAPTDLYIHSFTRSLHQAMNHHPIFPLFIHPVSPTLTHKPSDSFILLLIRLSTYPLMYIKKKPYFSLFHVGRGRREGVGWGQRGIRTHEWKATLRSPEAAESKKTLQIHEGIQRCHVYSGFGVAASSPSIIAPYNQPIQPSSLDHRNIKPTHIALLPVTCFLSTHQP